MPLCLPSVSNVLPYWITVVQKGIPTPLQKYGRPRMHSDEQTNVNDRDRHSMIAAAAHEKDCYELASSSVPCSS